MNNATYESFAVMVGDREVPAGYVRAKETRDKHAWENVDPEACRVMAANQTHFLGSDDTYKDISLLDAEGNLITYWCAWVRVDDIDEYYRSRVREAAESL